MILFDHKPGIDPSPPPLGSWKGWLLALLFVLAMVLGNIWNGEPRP